MDGWAELFLQIADADGGLSTEVGWGGVVAPRTYKRTGSAAERGDGMLAVGEVVGGRREEGGSG